MTYEKVFADLKKTIMKADASALEGSFAFQCCIEGEGAGTFYIAFEGGALSVEPYDYEDSTATFKASADTYKSILSGKLSVEDAVSSGALAVEGNEASCADILGFFAAKKPTRKTAAKKAAEKPAAKAAEKPAAKAAEKPAAKKAPAAKKTAAKKAEAKPAEKAETPKAAKTTARKTTKK